MADYDEILVHTRDEWRDWLAENHADSPGVWLVYHKKHTGVPRVAYEDAVEEAICFGWIDSTVRRLDDARYKQKFTPRRNGSRWSAHNRRRAEAMIAAGRMRPAGRRRVDEAKRTGAWAEALEDHVDRPVPPELAEILAADPEARANFRRWSPTRRKYLVHHVAEAKRPETRARRARKVAEMLRKNVKPGM